MKPFEIWQLTTEPKENPFRFDIEEKTILVEIQEIKKGWVLYCSFKGGVKIKGTANALPANEFKTQGRKIKESKL